MQHKHGRTHSREYIPMSPHVKKGQRREIKKSDKYIPVVPLSDFASAVSAVAEPE